MSLLVFVIVMVIGLLFSGVVHELGHLVMGLCNGWEFMMFQVGPFLWVREQIGGPIAFQLSGNLARWGGISASYPVLNDVENIEVWSKVLIAGPITSILVGVLFFVLYHFVHEKPILFIGLICFTIGMVTLIPLPFQNGITYNDGMRFKRLHSGGQEAKEEIAMFHIVEDTSIVNGKKKTTREDWEALIHSKSESYQYFGLQQLLTLGNLNEEEKKEVRKRLDVLKDSGKVTKYLLEEMPY